MSSSSSLRLRLFVFMSPYSNNIFLTYNIYCLPNEIQTQFFFYIFNSIDSVGSHHVIHELATI